MQWVELFTSLHGRINRQRFWVACAMLAVVETALQWLAYRVEGESLANIVDLALTYPEFSVAVKRANDRNLPPWLVGLFFAVGVAVDLFTLLIGPIDIHNSVSEVILFPFMLIFAVLIIELGFRRGTHGPNRFGGDPLGP
jgi:uncharacterized membrane protein YhaH (DUF805 family)